MKVTLVVVASVVAAVSGFIWCANRTVLGPFRWPWERDD
jgi:ABC-type branched-subunit amino acid transport system permease subunit